MFMCIVSNAYFISKDQRQLYRRFSQGYFKCDSFLRESLRKDFKYIVLGILFKGQQIYFYGNSFKNQQILKCEFYRTIFKDLRYFKAVFSKISKFSQRYFNFFCENVFSYGANTFLRVLFQGPTNVFFQVISSRINCITKIFLSQIYPDVFLGTKHTLYI